MSKSNIIEIINKEVLQFYEKISIEVKDIKDYLENIYSLYFELTNDNLLIFLNENNFKEIINY